VESARAVDCAVEDAVKMVAVAIAELVEAVAEERGNPACFESEALAGPVTVALAGLPVLLGVQETRCFRLHQRCCHRTWSPQPRTTGLLLD